MRNAFSTSVTGPASRAAEVGLWRWEDHPSRSPRAIRCAWPWAIVILLELLCRLPAAGASGTVVGWGWNGWGQTDVPAGLTNAVAVAAGNVHSVALNRDGTVVAWGNNSDWDRGSLGYVPARLDRR